MTEQSDKDRAEKVAVDLVTSCPVLPYQIQRELAAKITSALLTFDTERMKVAKAILYEIVQADEAAIKELKVLGIDSAKIDRALIDKAQSALELLNGGKEQ